MPFTATRIDRAEIYEGLAKKRRESGDEEGALVAESNALLLRWTNDRYGR